MLSYMDAGAGGAFPSLDDGFRARAYRHDPPGVAYLGVLGPALAAFAPLQGTHHLMPRRGEPQIGLAQAIRDLRKKRQLSQEALGLEAGIHPTWISHIESGRINPTWGNVRRLADALQVPLAELAELAEQFELQYRTAPRPGQGAGGQ